mgnify:FL=1
MYTIRSRWIDQILLDIRISCELGQLVWPHSSTDLAQELAIRRDNNRGRTHKHSLGCVRIHTSPCLVSLFTLLCYSSPSTGRSKLGNPSQLYRKIGVPEKEDGYRDVRLTEVISVETTTYLRFHLYSSSLFDHFITMSH